MPTTDGAVLEWYDTINNAYPVSAIEVYNGAVRVKRSSQKRQSIPERPESNKITRLSKKSLSRLAFLVTATQVKFQSILTLTFLEIETNGKRVKAMLNVFLTSLRRYLHRFEYVWFLEFQRRGAPHFHLLLSVPHSEELHRWIARRWSQVLQDETGKVEAVHRFVRTFENVREQNGAKRYALMYALKPYQKTVPQEYRDVGRFWGASRGVKPEKVADVEIDEKTLRKRLEELRPDINKVLPHFLPTYIYLPDESP